MRCRPETKSPGPYHIQRNESDPTVSEISQLAVHQGPFVRTGTGVGVLGAPGGGAGSLPCTTAVRPRSTTAQCDEVSIIAAYLFMMRVR